MLMNVVVKLAKVASFDRNGNWTEAEELQVNRFSFKSTTTIKMRVLKARHVAVGLDEMDRKVGLTPDPPNA